jgi:uncharacterized membrane protein YeaQ/YmgE (transglycosylase-associated protein family)
MDKLEEDTKKDIAKRLKTSDKKKWNSLTEEERKLVVDKYYDLRGIEHLGLDRIIDDYISTRKNFAFMIMGILLGVIGSIFGSILSKYLLNNTISDLLTVAFCFGLLFYFIHSFDKLLLENLNREDVLGHLLELVKKDK